MSEFLKKRETMKAEIDASYKSLVAVKDYLDGLSNAIHWMLKERDQLERTAAKFDQLNAENDKTETGEIEIDVDNAMTLLNEKFKEVNRKLAVIPVKPMMASDIHCKMLESRNKLEKTACNIVEYKFKKYGKVNVKECYKFEYSSEEFATTTLISTTNSPVKIELLTEPGRPNEFTHYLKKIFQGKECVFGLSIDMERLIAINGRYLKELNKYEVEAVLRKQIATGKVVLEIVQWKRYKDTNSIAFLPIDKQDSAIETSKISPTEPIINLQENKVVSTNATEKEEDQLNSKRQNLTADPPTCLVAAPNNGPIDDVTKSQTVTTNESEHGVQPEDSTIETSKGSSTEPIINLQENKVVSTNEPEKKENQLSGKRHNADYLSCFAAALANHMRIVDVKKSESVTANESEDGGQPEAKRVKLSADPTTCTVAAAGGVSTHQLTNSGTEKLVFKVKSSNNNEYRVMPVYGFVESGASAALQVTRTAGDPKEDKLVVHFGPAPVEAVDATAFFKEIKDTVDETITIPLVATE